MISAITFASSLANPTSNITINVIRPISDALVGDNLQVVVAVNSLYEVQTVKARVESRETDLVFSGTAYCDIMPPSKCHPGWTGNISLIGVSRGVKELTSIATDVFSNTAQVTISFIYDQPPKLTVQAPIAFSVATPLIQLAASCSDDDPAGCASIKVFAGGCYGAILASGKSVIDTNSSLASFDGQSLTVCFWAQDTNGQPTIESRNVFVESSYKLTEIESVGGKILDVQPDRILFLDNSNFLKIRNRLSGQDSTVPPIPGKAPTYGFLSPKGAIFEVRDNNPSYNNSFIYDWSEGVLTNLDFEYASSLKVKGNYAVWNGSPQLILRDLLSGINTTVSTSAGTNDVADTGEVVYTQGDAPYQVYRYRGGINTQLTNDVNLYKIYPSTDGINVVYRKQSPDAVPAMLKSYAIAMYGTGGEIILAPARTQEPNPGPDYQLNNGWIAYTKLDASEQLQIWTRSPTGVDNQVSFFATSSRINSLAPNGDVTFNNGNRLYLARYNATPIDIGTDLGKSFWQDGEWFVTIGRSLFQVDTTKPPLYILTVSPSGTGSGNVTGNGINCSWNGSSGSGICNVMLAENTAVTLNASPSNDSTFVGWIGCSGSGSGCSGTGDCKFDITETSGLGVVFNKVSYIYLPLIFSN